MVFKIIQARTADGKLGLCSEVELTCDQNSGDEKSCNFECEPAEENKYRKLYGNENIEFCLYLFR